MNTAAFPSPTAELAEINRIHYEMNYTEDISHRMRVPEKLQVAAGQSVKDVLADFQNTTVAMQVPERIFIAGDGDNSRPKDLDLVASQSSALGEPLALKTPPRILTLNDRPLDFLDLERSVPQTPQNEEVRSQGRIRRERSMSENTLRQNGQLGRMELIVSPIPQPLPPPPPRLYPPLTSSEDGSNLYSPHGILSVIQSTTRRAYQQVLDILDENRRRPVLRGGSAGATSNPLIDSCRYTPSNCDFAMEGTADDLAVVDAASLRRQIIKLNRRLQLLEEENRERTRREIIMYSITVGFWLINSWLWFRR
ncbi:mitochondrial fission factor homolog B isoform X1 [Callorhinchus milii]|uniref:Mitochondrial fission factor n=1 Tax=Callorhinchus milii TaxID=7868 RepID=V9KFX4_CALMI|nr:mitochondrial fission factor homolog B isoform X1 [Callorhinchus milii]XP_042194996.1 mitochondrial fission factor homolog B isoform X1 [Callorhinchus milii]|eukprot:gi/632933957/ref/XP_007894339.1/ PREDICTED: mitochondrial fission factor [Callorhinchus milii]